MPPRRSTAQALLARATAPATTTPFPPGGAGFAGGFSPAVQQQYDWVQGRAVQAQMLPRNPLEFLTGAFSPTVPMPPMPLDTAADGRERPDPRRFQYPVGYNLPSGTPGSEGLKLASFQNLRAFADLYSVARACLNVRQNELLGVEWDIVPTEDASAAMRNDTSQAIDFQRRVREAVSFFNRPDPNNYLSYHEWLRAILEDVFVVDALAIHLQPAKVPGRGVLRSNLAALALLDGTTIKPLLSVRGDRPRPPNPAYQQYLYGVPRRELMDLISGQDRELDGLPVDEYAADQLLYLRHQPRSWTPYGFSLIEQCILPIAIGVKGQQYTLAYYNEGSVPDTYVVDGRQGGAAQQSYQLQDMLNATASDLSYRRKIIVLPYNSKPIQMKPQALTAALAHEYAEAVCMVIDVSPQEIGLALGGRSGGLGGKGATEQQENATFRKSLKPLLTWLKRQLFDPVLQGPLGQTDMQWKWKGFEPEEDVEKKVGTLLKEVAGGVMAIDEARVELGRDPWGAAFTSKPLYFVGNGIVDLETGQVTQIATRGEPNATGGPTPEQAAAMPSSPLHQAHAALAGAGESPPPGAAAPAAGQHGAPVLPPRAKAATPDATTPTTPPTSTTHTGIMIALVPPQAVAQQIALADGEAPDELHVTLYYAPGADIITAEQTTRLIAAVQAFATWERPVTAELSGTTTFVPEDGDKIPYVALVSGGELVALRTRLIEYLHSQGFTVS